jgi:hypothetical protein
LILGLIFGIGLILIITFLIFYFYLYKRSSDYLMEYKYEDIFKKFKDFDQTRIRSDS